MFTSQFANYLKGKPCKVFSAPFDVRLNADGHRDGMYVVTMHTEEEALPAAVLPGCLIDLKEVFAYK